MESVFTERPVWLQMEISDNNSRESESYDQLKSHAL